MRMLTSAHRWVLASVAVLACAATAEVQAAATFQRLDLWPRDVSADGSVVVGRRNGAVRWTASGGTIDLGSLPGYRTDDALGVSADGRVVVGISVDADRPNPQPFRWSATGGMTDLGPPPPDYPGYYASAASEDGSVVVGNQQVSAEAFRWTASTGMVLMGAGSEAAAVSADGTVVVGNVTAVPTPGQSRPSAARWTASTGWVDLKAGRAGAPFSLASAVSADGSVVVGTLYSDTPYEQKGAFRWTASTGAARLPHLPGTLNMEAIDVSGDGSIVVGNLRFAGSDWEPFLWDETHGPRLLRDVLSGLGADLAGWDFQSVTGISGDGRTFIGIARDASGDQAGWVATVPEPASAALCVAAAGMLLCRRR